MQRITRPTLTLLKTPAQQRAYAKATLIGRLGQTPEVRETANGKKYVIYNLAVSRPPKRDDKGELVKGEDGYAVRDTDWFTIFNFRTSSVESLPRLSPGTQLLVEATLETRAATQAEGSKDILLRETSHQIVSFPKK